MRAELDKTLGAAYDLAVLRHQEDAAVEHLAQALTKHPELAECARSRNSEMSSVLATRSRGGRSACFITETHQRLLSQALTRIAA